MPEPNELDRLRLLPRRHAELGGLDLFARLDVPTPGTLLQTPERLDQVLAKIRAGVELSLQNPARIQGWHVQVMFGQVVQALNHCLFLKEEDQGSSWARSSMHLRPADYRIVLPDHANLLVEVKNHYSTDPLAPFSIRAAELAGLLRYAELATGRPMIAIYWAGPGFWTLIDPSRFTRRGANAVVDLPTALSENEMGLVGDMMIGMVPPLRLVLDIEQEDAPIVQQPDGTRNVLARIRGVHLEAGGRILKGKAEQRFVLYLMMNGRWEETFDSAFDGDKLTTVDFRYEPEEWPHEQGFAMVGFLSELYTRSFWQRTSAEGQITRLSAELDPASEGFVLARDYHSDELPLWRFHIKPKSAATHANRRPARSGRPSRT